MVAMLPTSHISSPAASLHCLPHVLNKTHCVWKVLSVRVVLRFGLNKNCRFMNVFVIHTGLKRIKVDALMLHQQAIFHASVTWLVCYTGSHFGWSLMYY